MAGYMFFSKYPPIDRNGKFDLGASFKNYKESREYIPPEEPPNSYRKNHDSEKTRTIKI
jgi:hypothetical protein